jgi:hypothetical protein
MSVIDFSLSCIHIERFSLLIVISQLNMKSNNILKLEQNLVCFYQTIGKEISQLIYLYFVHGSKLG